MIQSAMISDRFFQLAVVMSMRPESQLEADTGEGRPEAARAATLTSSNDVITFGDDGLDFWAFPPVRIVQVRPCKNSTSKETNFKFFHLKLSTVLKFSRLSFHGLHNEIFRNPSYPVDGGKC